MATIEDVQANATQIIETLTAVDIKLDEIRDFISNLQTGIPVTQKELDVVFEKYLIKAGLIETTKT